MEDRKATIPLEQAQEEVELWIEHKNIPRSKKESNEEQAKAIANAISDGYLTLDDETFEFTHTLLNPIQNKEGEITVSELKYKARLNSIQVDPMLKGIKPDDAFGLVVGYIRALTGQSTQVIKSLDTSSDLSLARSIATFFL